METGALPLELLASSWLAGLLVNRVLGAKPTELAVLHSFRVQALVFVRVVVALFAITTSERNSITGH